MERLLVEMGTGGGYSSSATLSVDFGDIVRKLDPYRVDLFADFGCFGTVDGAIG